MTAEPTTPLGFGPVGPSAPCGRAVRWRDAQVVPDDLQRLGAERGVGPEAVVYAAWALLLSRYTREQHVSFDVGLPARAAGPAGAADIVRVALAIEESSSVVGLLARIDAAISTADRTPRPGVESAGETAVVVATAQASGAVGGAALVVMAELAPRFRLGADYDRRRFEPDAVERLVGHMEQVVLSMLKAPDGALSEVPWLTGEERRQLLVDWNTTAVPTPTAGLHELVEAQAASRPEAVAVVAEDIVLTYRELDASSTRLANVLRARGVRPGTIIGVFLQRSAGMLVALLGILKTGGAYLPLDPDFPRDRLAFMLEDSGAPLVLTERSLAPDVPPSAADALCIDGDEATKARSGAPVPAPTGEPAGIEPDRLAYVLYTSGSTGRPKGVQITHAAIVNFLATMAKRPGLSPDDILVALTTLSFDIAALELFLPLTVGARTVVASSAQAADPGRLSDLLEAAGATVVQATPTTWRMLVNAGWPGRPGLKVLCGGEALPTALAGDLLRLGVELWNMYGPTETTVWSTITPVTSADRGAVIGRPIGNTTVYVLDPRLAPVPIGVPGELHIGGAGVALGYLGRPALTTQRFIPDHFAGGGRMYKTGDLVRWCADGNLEFLGRLDHQVKVRGFRIELGEVEAALDSHPSVRAAVVVARDDGSGESHLVGYVVPRGAPPAQGDLRRHIGSRLPAYMVPTVIVSLDALPLTPNGKVDRKALPPPDGVRPELVARYVAARTDTERAVAAIWSEVLGIELVGAEDDFFELGGHSLLAAHVVSCVRERLAAELELRSLYEAPTVAELATLVAAGTALGPEPPLVALDRSRFVR